MTSVEIAEQIVQLLEPLDEDERVLALWEVDQVYCSECGGPAFPYGGPTRSVNIYCQCSNDE